MTARSTCLSPRCGTRLLEQRAHCPDCGRRMFGDDEVGRRGWHILPLGFILAGTMGFAGWALDLLPAIAGAPGSSFGGTAAMAWVLLIGFGSIGLMGVSTVVAAVQMILGRSSRAATIAMILLFALGAIFIGIAVADAVPKAMAGRGA